MILHLQKMIYIHHHFVMINITVMNDMLLIMYVVFCLNMMCSGLMHHLSQGNRMVSRVKSITTMFMTNAERLGQKNNVANVISSPFFYHPKHADLKLLWEINCDELYC